MNALQAQPDIAVSSDTATVVASPASQHRICSVLYRNLSQGTRGDDVASLQEFLSSEGYLSAQATGYFGPMTAQAVAKWQASQGVSAVGSFGPMSRERMKAWCGGGVGPVACTKEYMPVCGSKPIVCITTPCNPIQQTYSNRCAMNADGATLLHEGQCRDTSGNPENDLRCKAWYDGCNSCSRETPNSPAMCTLRACTPESMTKPYCTAWFDSTGNKPPVISSFSGPTSLTVNEAGTWTISASDPENGTLSYNVRWGDENTYAPAMSLSGAERAFVQTTTFTHTYANAGVYTVTITVSDSAGKEAKTSSTVTVGRSVACPEIYAPVCGRPSGCANTCPAGMYCAMMCQMHNPVTYSSMCFLEAAGASLLHSGACTATSGSTY